MTYSCTDLADTCLEAADALALAIGAPRIPVPLVSPAPGEDKPEDGIYVAARDLKPGMRVNLEADGIADPDMNRPELEDEYAIVESIEVETPECVLVHFENIDSVGFPPDHTLTVNDPAADFNDNPAKQADYIVETMDAAEARIGTMRGAIALAETVLDSLANECTSDNPGLTRVFNRICEQTGIGSVLGDARRGLGAGLGATVALADYATPGEPVGTPDHVASVGGAIDHAVGDVRGTRDNTARRLRARDADDAAIKAATGFGPRAYR